MRLRSKTLLFTGMAMVGMFAVLYLAVRTITRRQRLVRRIVDTMPSMLYIYDLEERKSIFLNRTILNVLGYSADPKERSERDIFVALCHPDDRAKFLSSFDRARQAADGQIIETEYRLRTAAGDWRWFLGRNTVFRRNDDGSAQQVLGMIEDVTQRNQAENLLERIIRTMPNLVFLIDYDNGQIVFTNGGVTRTPGFAGETTREVGSNIFEQIIHEDDLPKLLSAWDRLGQIGEGEVVEEEFRIRAVDGATRWLMAHGTVFTRNPDGTPEQILGVAEDVTERKIAEDVLHTMSLSDDLTGLYNRRGFAVFSQQAIQLAQRYGRPVGLLFIDVDGLKKINDEHGHPTGDEALRDAAGVLKDTARRVDVVARLGGDEFGILVPEALPGGVKDLAGRIRRNVVRFNKGHERPYRLMLSIGVVASVEGDPCDLDQMMEQADRLMYEEKRRRRSIERVVRRKQGKGEGSTGGRAA